MWKLVAIDFTVPALSAFEVIIGNSFSGDTIELDNFQQCVLFTGSITPFSGTNIECTQAVAGQLVAVRGLSENTCIHFCELEVYTAQSKELTNYIPILLLQIHETNEHFFLMWNFVM